MIRKGTRKVEVENEGLVVFLYDESHAQRIEARNPSLLEGFGEDDADDEVLLKLARQGTLVAYEKIQDDDLDIDVIVGRRLTRKELAQGLWLEPQEGFIRLPSGRLRIDSYNSLGIGPEEPDADGVVVEVKPGDYVVTLYRLDLLALDDADLDDADVDPEDLPDEVIVLTDAKKANKPTPLRAMLRVPQETTDLPDWVGQYTIDGHTFRGLVRFDPDFDGFYLNLNPDAAAALDLRAEMRIELEVEGASRRYEAVYLGEETSAAMRIVHAFQKSKKTPKGFAHASWVTDSEGRECDHLIFQAMDEHFEIESELRDRWIPATATFSRKRD